MRSSRLGLTWAYGVWLGCCPQVKRGQPTFSGGLAPVPAAHAEIRAQRARIGQLLGQLRDAEREFTQDAIQRITTENTTLKQRVRQLTADNRTLGERLEAARSNVRFADRRIAQLEAQLTDASVPNA